MSKSKSSKSSSKSSDKSSTKAAKSGSKSKDAPNIAPQGEAHPVSLNIPTGDGSTMMNSQADPAMSRQPGSDRSTALGGPGPMSPTDDIGNFEGKPGEDIQMREPLAPTETRNAVAATSMGTKLETNVSRADAEGQAALAPEAHADNFDVRAVRPENIDKENQKRLDESQAEADKISDEQDKAFKKANA